jgi:alpha-tubulin suppressor-like RCC1 family protein
MSRFRLLAVATAYLAIGTTTSAAGTASRIAAGDWHTCAVTTGGGVLCWGYNASGQLGDGTTTNRLTPMPVIGLGSGVAAVAAGTDHTCALTSVGGVVCWGWNHYGQLGDGTTTDRLSPTPVVGLGSGVSEIAVGWGYTCALTSGRGVVCWGHNRTGQLGDGTTTDRLTPTPVTGLGNVVAIAAGDDQTCAITSVGGVVCWGENTVGELGDGTTTDRLTPTPVVGLGSGVNKIAAGGVHTCALTAAGGVLCWGYNLEGELGNGTDSMQTTPTAVSGSETGVVAITTGTKHACALTTAGSVLCWGWNAGGQLGDGTTTDRWTPTAAGGLGRGVAAIAAGRAHTCGLTTVGGIVCWGRNTEGQLGDGTTTDRYAPTVVAGLGGIPVPRPDFNADWRSDILWRHATRGEVWFWPMNGTSRTAEVFIRTVGEPGWEIRGQGDQNGDGGAEILWRHAPTGMLYLWTITAWGVHGRPLMREDYIGTVDPAYDIVGTGDYNGDRKSDILWRHKTNGELWVWLMDGATVVSSTYVTTVAPGYAVVGSGDLNADGKADIVWRHKTGGDVWVWLMNGATPTAMTYVTTIGDLGYQIVGVADHTGDGNADILWWHNTRGEVWLWPMNGATLVNQSYVGAVPDTGYRIVGNGDYDGDGKADILWHHATRGEVWVWLMNGATPLAQTYVASVPDTGYQIVPMK